MKRPLLSHTHDDEEWVKLMSHYDLKTGLYEPHPCCGWNVCKCTASPDVREQMGITICHICGWEKYADKPCRWCTYGIVRVQHVTLRHVLMAQRHRIVNRVYGLFRRT